MILIIIFLIPLFSAVAQDTTYSTIVENEWKGLVPLRSTKTDVEKILGKPVKQDSDSLTYKTDKEEVRVSYSKANCKGSMNGWNVPANTVLEFTVYPDKELKIAEDEFKNEKIFSYSLNSFILQEKGIAYGLDYGLDSKTERIALNVVKYISFMPKESDNNLRCKGFPTYNPIGSIYSPDDALRKENVYVGLDVLVTESMVRPPETMNYVIVYAGKSTSKSDYDKLFKSYETHLYKKRKALPEKIMLIKGGKRESFSIEVFNLRKDDIPPVPSPDYPSS